MAGRLSNRQYRTAANSSSGTTADSDQFSYDKAGRMLTAYSGRYSNTVGYSYDSAGRKKTEGLTISGQTYTTSTEYNARGELTKYTYPDSTVVDRTYTARGELYQIKHAGTTIDTRAYDNGGRMSSSTYNNGVVDTRAYGSDNTLSSITFTGSGTSIGNLSYAWDNNHNKTSETITGTMSSYGFSIPAGGYDDRLVSERGRPANAIYFTRYQLQAWFAPYNVKQHQKARPLYLVHALTGVYPFWNKVDGIGRPAPERGRPARNSNPHSRTNPRASHRWR